MANDNGKAKQFFRRVGQGIVKAEQKTVAFVKKEAPIVRAKTQAFIKKETPIIKAKLKQASDRIKREIAIQRAINERARIRQQALRKSSSRKRATRSSRTRAPSTQCIKRRRTKTKRSSVGFDFSA